MVPNEKGKGEVKRGFVLLLRSKAKPSPPKQYVKFKRQIRSEITKKFARKCIDAPIL